MNNLQYFVPFSPQELYLEVCLSANQGNYLVSYNSKDIAAAVKNFQCRSRSNLSEGAYQKSCESNQNWGSYGRKRPPTLRELSFKFHHQESFIETVVLIIQILNIIINMDNTYILLAENPCQGFKIEYFPKVEDHLVKKHGNISIRCLEYSQRLYC